VRDASRANNALMPTATAAPVFDRDTIARDLANLIAGEVRFGLHDRMLYATDASLYQVEPLGVVIPASIEDAVTVVRFCVDRMLPILPRGGGTSLAGQCTNRAIVLDLSVSCRAVLEVDASNRRCRVEPGVTIDELNALLASTGLFFAPDPATSKHCNIGGAIGNNAAGGRSILYGRTSESLIGVDVMLATGLRTRLERGASTRDPVARELTERVVDVVKRHERLIRERFPKTVRRNAGYGLDMVLKALDEGARTDGGDPSANVNLAHLLAGSEGTLAVTLKADLLLHPLPKAKGLATIAFASVDEAIEAVLPILATGPSAVELLDDVVLDLAAANAEYRRYVELMPRAGGRLPKAVLYVEYFAHGDAGADQGASGLPARPTPSEFLADRFALLRSRFGPARVNTYTDAASMLDAWKLRKAGEPLLHGMPGTRKPITFIEDNAIPVERLGEFVRRLREIVTRHGTRAAYWAHASVGVLHVRPMLDIHAQDDRERLRAIAVETARLARDMGGVMSGEHGDGRARGPLLEEFFGRELMGAFAEVKRVFDPRGLLNPGNIVPVGTLLGHEVGRLSEPVPLHPLQVSSVGDSPVHGDLARPASSTFSLRQLAVRASNAEEGEARLGGPAHHASRLGEPAYQITEHLRVKPGAADIRVPDVDTYFDYHDQHGFDGAVEMCNGAGVCRKKQGGTMCPSYMATLDERHSTRGRGNALRLAITGQLGKTAEARGASAGGSDAHDASRMAPGNGNHATPPPPPAWSDAQTIKTLDLCLSCKACKTECPSNVDIARLKAEFTAQRYRSQGGPPLAARIMASIRTLNRLGSLTPRLANAVSALPPVRRVIERVLGIHPQRSLPAFSRSLERDFAPADRFAPASGDDRPCVALFGDCFALYNEPGTGRAARRVLEACGYRVLLPRHACCSRPAISLGLLDRAAGDIDQACLDLRPFINDARVRAILFLEPSCLSAIKDDWLLLKVRTPLEVRQALAAKSWLAEDFIHTRWDLHPRRPAFTPASPQLGAADPIILHAHCHQKALWGAQTSAGLLRRLSGTPVHVLDSGCCGMAGSFGYAEHRYDLSMKIGELALLPAVRAAQATSPIAAPGTSCRHQIKDGTARNAKHPIEIVADRLAPVEPAHRPGRRD